MHLGEDFTRAKAIIELALDPLAYISHSQFGENLLIDLLFHNKTIPSFYVNVRAHHPKRLFNTYSLHRKGLKGINIEINPNLPKLFLSERSGIINVSNFLSDKAETGIFSGFNETAINTISTTKASHYLERCNIASSEQIKTRTFADVLNEYYRMDRILTRRASMYKS